MSNLPKLISMTYHLLFTHISKLTRENMCHIDFKYNNFAIFRMTWRTKCYNIFTCFRCFYDVRNVENYLAFEIFKIFFIPYIQMNHKKSSCNLTFTFVRDYTQELHAVVSTHYHVTHHRRRHWYPIRYFLWWNFSRMKNDDATGWIKPE